MNLKGENYTMQLEEISQKISFTHNKFMKLVKKPFLDHFNLKLLKNPTC